MEKCSPVQMRRNLEIAERYKNIGLDFVSIPVKDESHRCTLMAHANECLEEICREAEK